MWLGLLLGALACYGLKLAGLSVPRRVLENNRVRRISALLPVALLAALIAIQTFSSSHRLTLDARSAGVLAAFTAVLLRAPFLVVVLVAAATTALVRHFV
ncbi:AzlD domain-containing protein [Kitasatospora sp. GP82]|uniref:AzlD domain-containing protein n=1 Tax=Kitasatospora sp. GP82 TaxID=3035089 RepID=UPI00247321FF|nr:AzlD domain-containing protein [Kitasatospora sp. GP82]MDH6125385.1 putative membrane protein [Kitasatospora sp. GP82]